MSKKNLLLLLSFTLVVVHHAFVTPQYQQHYHHQQQRQERTRLALSWLSNFNKNSNNNDSDEYPSVRLNKFFRDPVPDVLLENVALRKEGEDPQKVFDWLELVTAPPGMPGVPRPLWLVVVASLPTGLLWYGYYKFAVEEELLEAELAAGKTPRGFGGYGTLGPFTYGMLLGPVAELLHLPGGIQWTTLGVVFIYYTQFLLYDRVNELYSDEATPPPLKVWWCLPIFFPFNLIVGLRQVHFLSQYWYKQRGVEEPPFDPVVEFFPFIGAPSFTWQDFCTKPSMWCVLLRDQPDIDRKRLPEPIQQLLKL